MGLILVFLSINKEHFGATQGGALIQLMAKGAQDVYLTGEPRYYRDYYRSSLRGKKRYNR